jgi:hypothetical protein
MKHLHRTLAFYILVLNLIDLLTTFVSINGGGVEMNPVINAVGNWWIVGAYKLMLPLVMIAASKFMAKTYPAIVLIQSFFIFLYVSVIANNLYWIL